MKTMKKRRSHSNRGRCTRKNSQNKRKTSTRSRTRSTSTSARVATFTLKSPLTAKLLNSTTTDVVFYLITNHNYAILIIVQISFQIGCVDIKVEFWHLVLAATVSDEFIFYLSSLFISNFFNFLRSFRMTIKEVIALAYNLLDEVFPVDPLSIFVNHIRTVSQTCWSTRYRQTLVILIHFNHPLLHLLHARHTCF